jgi:hypothetical protein
VSVDIAHEQATGIRIENVTCGSLPRVQAQKLTGRLLVGAEPAPSLPEASYRKSGSHWDVVQHGVVLLSFDRRNVSDWFQQAFVVEATSNRSRLESLLHCQIYSLKAWHREISDFDYIPSLPQSLLIV